MSETPLATSTVIPSLLPTASPTTAARSSATTSQSPLLFFVALGFGVLFTNLWIIIGVKYCFRYQTARRRGITLSQMNAEIAAANAQQRTGRRRREKKLMTIDEVNQQFPLQSYKAWRASREREGLSTEGGMQAVADPVAAVVARQEMQQEKAILSGDEDKITAAAVLAAASAKGDEAAPRTSVNLTASRRQSLARGETYAGDTIYEVNTSASEQQASLPASQGTDKTDKTLDVAEVGIAEAPTTPVAESAAPPTSHPAGELVSGDTCAICIDVLEEDDDVRGLTCGHAFHSACVDQWLTTRRAICPLCKKDYWVRKAPVAGEGDTSVEHDAAARGSVAGMLESFRTFRLPRFRNRADAVPVELTDEDRRNQRRSRRRNRTAETDLEQGREMVDLGTSGRAGPSSSTVQSQSAVMAGVSAAQR